MSDSRPNENVKPDRAENTGETPPESTPKAGDGSTSDSTGGQWAAAARDSLYSVYETALKATGIVPAKPEQVPETINFADKPILPVEKAAATELVRPAGDTKPATSDSSWFSFLKVDSLTSFFESGAKPGDGNRAGDIYDRGVRKDPFESASQSDPFFRGFAFGSLGGSSIGGGRLDARSDVFKDDTFNFDGLLDSDFFSSKSDSKAGSARFITNLGLDKVGSSLSEYFFSSKDTGPPTGTDAGKASEKGRSVVGDAVESVKRIGSNVIEGAEGLLNYIFGDSTSDKPADTKTERTLKRNADGSTSLDMQTPENGRLQVHTTDQNIHVESDTHGTVDRSKGDGPQDVRVQTTDGRNFHQSSDGTREASSERSDLKVEQKGEKVLIKDKNGNQIAEFGSAGDAQRFLDNGEISFARPGETVEQAAERIKTEQGERWNNNNHIITDGQGNVLTVDEDGNSLRRYPNGTVEMHYQKEGEDGQKGHVDVRLSRRNGRTIVSIKGADGEYHETDAMTARQVREQLAGSDLSWDNERLCRGRRHNRPAPGAAAGDQPAPPASPVQVMDDQGRVQVSPTTTIDAATGEVKVKEGDNEITVKANTETGQVVLSESESGRTITQDQQGRIVVQGRDEADRISFDPTTGVLDAFGIEMTDNGTNIRNRDGSSTRIDRSGNFELFDKNNNSLLKAIDNAISLYDGTEIYEDNEFFDAIEEALEEQERRHALQAALAEAYEAMAFAQSIVSSAAGVLSPGAIAGQLASLQAAMAHCLAHGIAPPGELAVAEARLRNAIPDFDHQIHLQGKLTAELGTVNNALITYALHSNDPATAVAYAKRLWGGGDAKTV